MPYMDRMPTVMNHDFSNIPRADIPRSSFNRSHGMKTAFDAGYLVPIFLDEVLPGDTCNLNMSGFGRLATPINPIMDNAYIDTQFFFIPKRLVWDNWQKFNGEQDNPGDSTDYQIPVMSTPVGGYALNSLQDYMGLPIEVDIEDINSLPFRCYQLCWNEWYRDENLQDSVIVDTGDGPDLSTNYGLLKRGKRHDYFTSCLPWPQKGDAVSLPLGTSADVSFDGVGSQYLTVKDQNNNSNTMYLTGGSIASQGAGLEYEKLYANLEDATAATINQLREAFQVQRLYERDARGGTRYTEIVKSHFGVTSPDARLQRPEYLGGGSSSIQISPIAQTSSTDATTPQGNLSGVGTVGMNGHGFTKSFTEHGYIIGLASVRADLTYQKGINRMWTRQTRWDFYWPGLAHLGEQAVLSKELYADGSVNDQDVFGYQERFAEYRYKQSNITGLFRSDAAQSLDAWHLSQDFTTRPVLDDTFIEENPPFDRVIAVPSEPHIIFDAYFNYKCARPMPTYGVPGMIDHF